MLTAIIVYNAETGDPITDKVWGLTTNGTLPEARNPHTVRGFFVAKEKNDA